MEKIILNINPTKLSQDKIVDRTYKNKNGEQVTEKQLKLEVVPLKEKRFISEGDGWKLWKTHFVAEPSGKDEETNFVGDGVQFEREDSVNQKFEEITRDKSPF